MRVCVRARKRERHERARVHVEVAVIDKSRVRPGLGGTGKKFQYLLLAF